MVILLTAHGTVDSAFEAKGLRAFAYLQKPYERENLLETVGRALNKLTQLDIEIIRPRPKWTR
jgi:DNA-binding NtrC family response regulator